jgi:uncharacterized MAPEG superfamily protein
MDNLTISAIVIAIILIYIVFTLARKKADADRRMLRMSKQFSIILHNDKAIAYCKRVHEKYPNFCAGIDFMLKVKGDNVEIEEWNSDKPRPD